MKASSDKTAHSDRNKIYICKHCNQEFSYDKTSHSAERLASAFKKRGNVCGLCEVSISPTISTETSESRKGSILEKYISVSTLPSGRSRYYLSIFKNRRRLSRAFADLNDAIALRDIAIEFYNNNGRFPTHDEQNILFPKCQTHKRELSKTVDRSTVQLKNICHNKKDDRYNVIITRDGVVLSTSFKSLDDAITARDMVLDEYDKTGRLMTRGEVIAKLDELNLNKEKLNL